MTHLWAAAAVGRSGAASSNAATMPEGSKPGRQDQPIEPPEVAERRSAALR